MLRFDISPTFKAHRKSDPRAAFRGARSVPVANASDGLSRLAVIFSLPATLIAISLFTAGGAAGPQVIANIKQKAVVAVTELRARDPFLRHAGIDYTPTGSTCAQGAPCARERAAAPVAKVAPLLKAPKLLR